MACQMDERGWCELDDGRVDHSVVVVAVMMRVAGAEANLVAINQVGMASRPADFVTLSVVANLLMKAEAATVVCPVARFPDE